MQGFLEDLITSFAWFAEGRRSSHLKEYPLSVASLKIWSWELPFKSSSAFRLRERSVVTARWTKYWQTTLNWWTRSWCELMLKTAGRLAAPSSPSSSTMKSSIPSPTSSSSSSSSSSSYFPLNGFAPGRMSSSVLASDSEPDVLFHIFCFFSADSWDEISWRLVHDTNFSVCQAALWTCSSSLVFATGSQLFLRTVNKWDPRKV